MDGAQRQAQDGWASGLSHGDLPQPDDEREEDGRSRGGLERHVTGEPGLAEREEDALDESQVVVRPKPLGDVGLEVRGSVGVRGVRVEEGEAAGKWIRAQLSSTQLSTYYVGNMEINGLRKAYEKKAGDRFDLKKFHNELLSFGSPAPKYVGELMDLN